MHYHRVLKLILPACLLLLGFLATAQDAESIRASNFMALQRLLTLKAIAPYYLTAADLAQISLLQGQTETQTCQNVTTTNCPPVILPVTGLQLAGQRTNTEKVQLSWETKAEYNCKGFVLERQSAGNALLYDSLFFAASAGNSYSKKTYNYIDLNSYKGNSFYRVKQVDLDGKFTYSNVVMVEGYSGKFAINVSPNPATGQSIRVYFQGLDANQNISLIVSNSTGKQLLKKDNIRPDNGYIDLNSQLFASGYYFVTVYTNSGVYTKSFSMIN